MHIKCSKSDYRAQLVIIILIFVSSKAQLHLKRSQLRHVKIKVFYLRLFEAQGVETVKRDIGNFKSIITKMIRYHFF